MAYCRLSGSRWSDLRACATAVAMAGAVIASSSAQAAEQCLTEAEAQSLFAFAMPSVITSMATKCTPLLPQNAILRTAAPRIVAGLRPAADKAWPQAKAAFGKISGTKLPTMLGDTFIKRMAETAFSAGVMEQIKPDSCPRVDRVVGLLAPLPAENLSGLVVVLFEMGTGGKGDTQKPPFTICPEVPVAAPKLTRNGE